MTRLRTILLACCCLLWSQSACAATPAERCEAIRSLDLKGLQDAPTVIVAAQPQAAEGAAPALCQVSGKIDGDIGFTIALPLDGWNGKFFQGGCGGACGNAHLFLCDEPLKRGYACMASDMGHSGGGLDWSFAYNNLKGLVDFGFRSTHRATLAGKAVTAAFYSAAPVRSYFSGCSTGGRQALMAAQYFPTDFDGIIAGAPAIDETGAGMQLLWSVLANRDAGGHELLHERDVVLLHEAVLKSCDMNDGVRDGIIGDARLCHFDPAALLCKPGQSDACLTAAQVLAAQKIYAGPHTSDGKPLYTGGLARGSELNWMGAYISKDGKPPLHEVFITSLFQNFGFSPAPGPAWKAGQFDFDHDYQRFGLVEPIFSANNPDLRKFKARGGKLIGYQGWDDNSVVPLNYIDYYQNVVKVMDGPAATNDFFRLFTIPGMRHCGGGPGADTVNYVDYLEQWVEHGQAPDMVLGSHLAAGAAAGHMPTFPLTGAVAFTRPHYAYPGQYQYNGSGDPTSAASYHRVEPDLAPPPLGHL